MVKSNNKGFSLVEVIIAAAVFAILVYPITNALVTTSKTATLSTKKQYAVEKTEEIMETFKKADLSGDVSIVDGDGTSSYVFTKGTPATKYITLPNSEKIEYTTTTYTCNDIKLGENYEKYKSGTVEVNDAAYQVLKHGYVLEDLATEKFKTDGSGALVTNVTESGTVRNLDSKQSAIIIGATYSATAEGHNLDNLAYRYFIDAKVDFLRKYEVQYNHYLSGAGDNTFAQDSFEKNTTIKITKSGKKYTVECMVEYTDRTKVSVIESEYAASGKNIYKPTTAYGDGVVYRQEFTDELPPIYLLYVPALYNGSYCEKDYITVDNSTVSDKAKVYVFESTADLSATYANIIKEQFGVTNVSDITYQNAGSTLKMADVDVILKLAAGASDSSLEVYSNFDFDNADSDMTVKRMDDDQSGDVYMYDIEVTITDSKGSNTTITGTRGK